jgi:Ala-tRNA(Pro) deacylase
MNIPSYLEEQGCWHEELAHEPSFSAQRLAQRLHVPGRAVAKTVLLRVFVDHQRHFVVAVLPATKQIDLRQAGSVAGGTAELATEFEIAEHCPDCDFGVLPPFGSWYDMKTIVDSSLADDDEIWFEGNTHNEAVRMKFNDFQRIERPQIASFAVRSDGPATRTTH